MLKIRIQSPAARSIEELLQMHRLGIAHHIPDRVCLPNLDPVLHGSQVRGGITITAITLPDHERSGIRVAGAENAQGTLALAGEAGGFHFSYKRGQAVIVKALAEVMIESDVQFVINHRQAREGNIHAALPDRAVFQITCLELDQFGAAGIANRRIAALSGFHGFFLSLAFGIHRFVEPQKFADRIGQESGFIPVPFPSVKDHAELRAPVADVVICDDLVP